MNQRRRAYLDVAANLIGHRSAQSVGSILRNLKNYIVRTVWSKMQSCNILASVSSPTRDMLFIPKHMQIGEQFTSIKNDLSACPSPEQHIRDPLLRTLENRAVSATIWGVRPLTEVQITGAY